MSTEPMVPDRASGAPTAPYPATARAATMESPVGELALVIDASGSLLRIAFEGREDPSSTMASADPSFAPLRRVITQLREYFAGERREFDGIALAPAGTAFQQRVWALLQRIPYGETWSYAQMADALSPKAHARPVGGANGRNPIPIIIPCHRVIGADRQLTGFGGGLLRKRWLLAHEGAEFIDHEPRDRQLPIF
ncbi:MAG: methylated-DNA--[protein]-cysteine S-methyltransferase [Pseudomonadota bacterium]